MSTSIDNRHFLLRRAHSLLGLIPVGAFLAFHMWENSQSWQGSVHYNEVVEEIASMNLVLLFEIFGIALPILFHAAYGVVIWSSGRSNATRYGFVHNWMFVFQRVSGFVILAFVLFHVWQTRIAAGLDEAVAADLYGHMATLVSNPLTFAVYVLGMAFAAVHLGNGLWTMGISWGLTTTVRAQRISFVTCLLISGALIALGVRSLLGFLVEPATVMVGL
jgi:succinate dehydrogenase / fumarate reductase, cytochrome b subunit